MDNEKILDISWRTIIKISLSIIGIYLIYSIKDIIVWFVFALVISILFDPIIDFLQKKRIPRIIGIAFVYFGFFGIFIVLIYLIIPLVASEVHSFLVSFPEYFEKISPPLQGLGFQAFENMESFVQGVSDTLKQMSSSIFSVIFALFGGVFSFLGIITMAVFLSLEEKAVQKALVLFFPKKYEDSILGVWDKCQRKVAGWFGVRVIASLFVGIASYITFLIFNVEYPFVLALFAAAFNFVPYIGPFFTMILLFLIIFPSEMLKAVFVLVVFFLIQQIDANVLSPLLMKRIIGIPPVLVVIALIVGASLWGVLGAFLAIPLAGVLFEFLKEFLQRKKEKEAIEQQPLIND
ncbi:MAG: AI-2E family transporter [Patescibacteria group bacterium]|nr:AI-2E family transporter [Patescibacteria group bacterium]